MVGRIVVLAVPAGLLGVAVASLLGLSGPAESDPTGRAGPHLAPDANLTQERPWFEEDFSGYRTTEDLLRYPNPRWSGVNEDANRRLIELDPEGPPVGGQAMRYAFPDRSEDPRLCHDFTIGRNLKLPATVPEVWVEFWVRFSPSFMTAPIRSCAKASAAGYKLVFLRVQKGGRFNLIAGVFGTQTTWGYPGRPEAHRGGPHPASYIDGKWHRVRLHARVGPNGVATAFIDERPVKSFTNVEINSTGIYGIALGRNRNQGPTEAASVWWGRVRAFNTDPGWGW